MKVKPAISLVRDSARNISCLNNLRQLGLGMHGYMADNEGLMSAPAQHVDAITWDKQLYQYVMSDVATRKEQGDALWAETQGKNNLSNAVKIIQYTLHTALTGCFQSNAQWNIGYGPAWTRANVTFAVLTSLLEDRQIVADIWPTTGQRMARSRPAGKPFCPARSGSASSTEDPLSVIGLPARHAVD